MPVRVQDRRRMARALDDIKRPLVFFGPVVFRPIRTAGAGSNRDAEGHLRDNAEREQRWMEQGVLRSFFFLSEISCISIAISSSESLRVL
jgi:hypothetical protein